METAINTFQQHINRMMEIADTLRKARLMIGEEYNTWCSEFGREESAEILATENALIESINNFSNHVAQIMLFGMFDELKKEERS